MASKKNKEIVLAFTVAEEVDPQAEPKRCDRLRKVGSIFAAAGLKERGCRVGNA